MPHRVLAIETGLVHGDRRYPRTTEFAEQGCLHADQFAPFLPGKRLEKFHVVVQSYFVTHCGQSTSEGPMFGTEHVVVKTI